MASAWENQPRRPLGVGAAGFERAGCEWCEETSPGAHSEWARLVSNELDASGVKKPAPAPTRSGRGWFRTGARALDRSYTRAASWVVRDAARRMGWGARCRNL